MTAVTATADRRLPRGWAHLGLQFAIWIGFYAVYQVARGAADHSVSRAFANGEWIIDFQRRLGAMIELPLQHLIDHSSLLIQATSYTYWLSQFAVVGIALLYIYFRAHERFFRFRNTLIIANLIGLVGYVTFPTAPPRMFPQAGFADTLAQHAALTHNSSIVQFSANPYAAMPSLHSCDALIVGVTMATRRAQALGQGALAGLAPVGLVQRDGDRQPLLARHRRGDRGRRNRSGDRLPPVAASPLARRGMSVKTAYTSGARVIAARSMTGLARTRVTPNMLTAAGVTLCAVGAVLVYFEYRNEVLFYWTGALAFVVGSVLDILDGALARAGGKQTPFGGFLDSTLDRVGEGLMLGSISLVFMRDGQELALAFAVAAIGGSFLVPYARAKAEGLGIKGDVGIGSRAERVDRDLCRARTRAVGCAAVGDRSPRRNRVVHRAAADPARPPRAAVVDLDRRFDDARELGPRADAELAVDVPEVELDRLHAEEQSGSGLPVRRAACDERGDLQLLRRESVSSLLLGRPHRLA